MSESRKIFGGNRLPSYNPFQKPGSNPELNIITPERVKKWFEKSKEKTKFLLLIGALKDEPLFKNFVLTTDKDKKRCFAQQLRLSTKYQTIFKELNFEMGSDFFFLIFMKLIQDWKINLPK